MKNYTIVEARTKLTQLGIGQITSIQSDTLIWLKVLVDAYGYLGAIAYLDPSKRGPDIDPREDLSYRRILEAL